MTEAFGYATLVARNRGYVAAPTQAKIRELRLLIAGCGMGSGLAISAARFGFERFVLVDGDVVAAHNLNRQFYDQADVGAAKVAALRAAILRINPAAQVEARNEYLDADNTDAIVAGADLVFDTVDFVDLPAILRLHRSAHRHRRAILTALNIGFGAGVLCFPAGGEWSLADLLAPDLDAAGGGESSSYAAVYGALVARLGPHLDRQVVEEVGRVLTLMEDGRPCPASQISVGSFTVAAMGVAMLHDLLAGLPVPAAPIMVLHSFRSHQTSLVNLAPAAGSAPA